MSECPDCGMRDDDWFLCRRDKCAIKTAEAEREDLVRLRAENERLAAERDEAIAAWDKFAEPAVKSFQFENGEFNLSLTGPAMERISAAVVGNFKALGAENYYEISLFDREEPYQRYVLTVQKVSAKSPHELRLAAEAREAKAVEDMRERAAKCADNRPQGSNKSIARAIRALPTEAQNG